MPKSDLTQKRLKSLLRYEPKTGWFYWSDRRNGRVKLGQRAGFFNAGLRYRMITVDLHDHFEHRLVWLWVHGRWPLHQIDHINRDRVDNRLCNLRDVPPLINARNRSLPKNNTSGVMGVSFSKSRDAWVAYIGWRPRIQLGTFKNKEDAIAARQAAEGRLWKNVRMVEW